MVVADDDRSAAAFGRRHRSTAVADPPVIASGRRLGDRYRLVRPLGQGGMASVWLADDERLGRAVAVKVISEALAHNAEYAERFRREATVAARLQHPNLVAVYDFDAGARPYLVMEYIAGGDLATRVREGKAPEPERLACELLSALRHMHAAGVVHRDIKPQNVLIDESGRARLSDFGIAQPSDATALTRTGHVLGTERYLAPEVRAGTPATASSDLYSLGVLLGEVAREGASARFWELVERLRSPAPGGRPASAARALADFERAGERPQPGEATQPFSVGPAAAEASARPGPERRQAPIASPLERAFETPPVRRSRRLRAVGALALAALAVGGAVALALGTGDDNEGPSRGASPAKAKVANQKAARDREPKEASRPQPAGGPAPAEPVADDSASEGPPAVDGAALNDRGFALVNQGRYEEAVPILERARKALAESGDETTYHYATYNLATALLGAGRPADAIPLLRERMQFDDGQLPEVRETLQQALAAAGQRPRAEPGGRPAPGERRKPGPPPWANDDEDD